MGARIFSEGMPQDLVAPMFNNGYAIKPGMVDEDFAADLFAELLANGQYCVGEAERGTGPGVFHNPSILKYLGGMPLLREYRHTLNEAITDVSGYSREHLTYLTVRACPVGEMSTRIHRNDRKAGPWLVALTVASRGSFGIYPDSLLAPGDEIPLLGNDRDPETLAWSEMGAGDAWGIYSREWSAPHAGGPNSSPDPKVLVLLYGWNVIDHYPHRTKAQAQY